MEEILQKIREVYNLLIQKEARASQILAEVIKREEDIQKREVRNSEYESAKAVLDAAEQTRKNNDAKLAEVEEEKIRLDNWLRSEREKLSIEATRLLPLQDKEKQLAADRQALCDREAALEAEKRDFKNRYIEKIKLHFKNTGGAPDPDAIT